MMRKTTLLLALMVLLAGAANAADLDHDGLPDSWEVDVCGSWTGDGCNPRRQDLILVACLRPGVDRRQVTPTLDRVQSFFSGFPGLNPDGSSGIHVIILWGNPLAEADADTDYPLLYERAMPRRYRGVGHGVLIAAGTRGGGQTNRPDWSGVSNNWKTIVHELGHQLGLGHEPPGSTAASPLYTSLMNYDYNYQFAGDPDAVHFSRGRFTAVRLDESVLNETLPFPLDDLSFLSEAPYGFRLQRAGHRLTRVDWNRNGTAGEHSVRADVNDGYSVLLRDVHKIGKAAGAPSLVAVGPRRLLVVFPDLPEDADYARYEAAALSPERRGHVAVRSYDGESWSEKRILIRNVDGDVHAVFAHSKLLVAVPNGDSYVVDLFEPRPPFRRLALNAGLDDFVPGQRKQPVLVVTKDPEQVWLFLWNEATKAVTYRPLSVSPDSLRFGPVRALRAGTSETSPAVLSQFPIHAVFDRAQQRIALVTSEPQGRLQGRMKVHTLAQTREGGWFSDATRWTMGPEGGSRSRARPWILYDPSRDRSPSGGYLIYHKGDAWPPNTPSRTWLSRTLGDRTTSDGWRTKLMGNEWTATRSTPAAAFFRGEIAYALRWYGGDDDDELLVNLHASGVEDGLVADFDDVTFIRTQGLRQSLGR